MNEREIEDIEAVGNKVVPATWMGSDLLPMEYSVETTSYAYLLMSLCLLRIYVSGLQYLKQ